jgi:hypothetical protein
MVGIAKVDVSILIVNWNVRDLLRECLCSIYERTQGVTFEVVVVDNASSDGSVEMIRSEFPEVKLVTSRENLGFGKANNAALPLCAGRYIGLLNPDAVLLNDTFAMLVSKLDSESRIGIVGPKLLNLDGTVQWVCARRSAVLRNTFGALLLSRWTSNSIDNYDVSQVVDCISGACMLIRREVLVDGYIFDPLFFMYGEDVDLCYQTIRGGWKVFYLDEARVLHYGAESSKQAPSASGYAAEAGYRLLVKHHGLLIGRLYRFLSVPVYAMKLAIAMLMRLYPGHWHDPAFIQRSLVYREVVHAALGTDRAGQKVPKIKDHGKSIRV